MRNKDSVKYFSTWFIGNINIAIKTYLLYLFT
jgi:hypothetical protein